MIFFNYFLNNIGVIDPPTIVAKTDIKPKNCGNVIPNNMLGPTTKLSNHPINQPKP